MDNPNSILYWRYKIEDYDIRFGIYEFKQLETPSKSDIDKILAGDKENYNEIVKLRTDQSGTYGVEF